MITETEAKEVLLEVLLERRAELVQQLEAAHQESVELRRAIKAAEVLLALDLFEVQDEPDYSI